MIAVIGVLAYGTIVKVLSNLILRCICARVLGGRRPSISVRRVYRRRHYRYRRKIVSSTTFRALGIFMCVFLVSLILGVVVKLIKRRALTKLFAKAPVTNRLVTTLIKLVPGYTSSMIVARLCLSRVVKTKTVVTKLLMGTKIKLLVLFHLGESEIRGLGVIKMLCKLNMF